MPSRKAVVIPIAVAVVLSVGFGIVAASEATVSNHTVFQVNDDRLDDLTGPQTANIFDVSGDSENYDTPSIDEYSGTFLFGSGSEAEDEEDDVSTESGSDPGLGPELGQGRGRGPPSESASESNRGRGPESAPGHGPQPRPREEPNPRSQEEDADDTDLERGSEPEPAPAPESGSDQEPRPESDSQSESDPEGNAEDTESDSGSESAPESGPDREPESESEPEPEPALEPDPEQDENAEDTESSSRRPGSSPSSGPASGDSDSVEPVMARTEAGGAVTIHVDDANGENVVQSLDLAGPSETDPAISLSTLDIDPADREQFEMTVARPTSDPGELPAVAHGEALAYVDLETDLGANGTTNLSFELDRNAIPDGLGIEDVEILQYVDGEWTAATMTHDVGEEAHRVTLSEASPIAVVALEPGSVGIVDADVPADWVRAGHKTRAKVTVRNAGDRPAEDTLTLVMDGVTVAERNVSLEPDETATVDLAFQPTDSGAVTLEGSEIGTLTVADGNDGDDENSTAGEPATAEDMPGFGPVSIVLAFSVLVLGARIRQWATSRRVRP